MVWISACPCMYQREMIICCGHVYRPQQGNPTQLLSKSKTTVSLSTLEHVAVSFSSTQEKWY